MREISVVGEQSAPTSDSAVKDTQRLHRWKFPGSHLPYSYVSCSHRDNWVKGTQNPSEPLNQLCNSQCVCSYFKIRS